ncbi:MAG: hypothetical protein L7S56_00605 [Candidatus Poseidonia sp.]|nr:hypothetical protein [Poseidonia sp.]
MRVTHPLWPAVQEVARTLLREPQLIVSGPEHLSESIQKLNRDIGNALPSRTTFHTYTPKNSINVEVFQTNDDLNSPIIQLGGKQPSVTTQWIPGDGEDQLSNVLEAAYDLLDAGYPGCLGCGGPGSEVAWDEQAHRLAMKDHQSPYTGA